MIVTGVVIVTAIAILIVIGVLALAKGESTSNRNSAAIHGQVDIQLRLTSVKKKVHVD